MYQSEQCAGNVETGANYVLLRFGGGTSAGGLLLTYVLFLPKLSRRPGFKNFMSLPFVLVCAGLRAARLWWGEHSWGLLLT